MNVRRKRNGAAVIAALLLFVGTACSPPDETPTETSSGSASQSSYTTEDRPIRWVDSGILDLNSPDGTFIRAVAETNYLLLATHDYRIVPTGYIQATSIRPIEEIYDNDRKPRIPAGVVYLTAIPFPQSLNNPRKTDSPPATDEVGRAAICYSVNPLRYEFEPQSIFIYKRSGHAPPPNQFGPRNQPTVNVFGDWTLQDYGVPTREDREACAKAKVLDPTSTLGSEPNPGWPRATQ